jgi:hypothetical protein
MGASAPPPPGLAEQQTGVAHVSSEEGCEGAASTERGAAALEGEQEKRVGAREEAEMAKEDVLEIMALLSTGKPAYISGLKEGENHRARDAA